ncbi:MAG: hypothetical protein ABGX16_20500 [Pirellulales bacterium]
MKSVARATVLTAVFSMFLALAAPARSQQLSKIPTVMDAHPTIVEFREDISRADVVVRAKIVELLRRKEGVLADQDALVEVIRTYKGELPEPQPCVRMEIYQALERKAGVKLARVGDEVILPIEFVHPYSGAKPRNGQKLHYMVPFYYVIEKDGTVSSAFGFPTDMREYASIDRFEKLILDEVNRPQSPQRKYETAEVLFTDNFDDGSLAGWTFLVGERGFKKEPFNQQFDVIWIGPNSMVDNELHGTGELETVKVAMNSQPGLYHAHRNDTEIEIGVVDGRLRLRSSNIWAHLTAVTGDPQWTDYQIDVDMINLVDKELPHARANYMKFGPYGRLRVPNMPETRGEHSFVGVEFGNFANYDVSEETFGNAAFQIRCKYPEEPVVWRDHSRMLRKTKILDYHAWSIPQHKQIHLTAKYFGNQVEGWIDGKKVLSAEIPADHPGIKNGRIALWTFETWVEFDNVQVTRLVPLQ